MDCGNADKRGSTNLVFFSRISPYMVRKTKRMTGKLELSTESTCRKHRGEGDCGRAEQKVRIIRKFSDKTKTIERDKDWQAVLGVSGSRKKNGCARSHFILPFCLK